MTRDREAGARGERTASLAHTDVLRSGRREQRQAAAHRVRLRRRIVAGMLVALAIECGAAAFTSPLVRVRRIEVRVSGNLGADELAQVVQASAVPAGTNLLLAPTGVIQRTIAGMPYVSKVTVSRRLFGLSVCATARQPAALAHSGAVFAQVDNTGFTIRLQATPASDLPAIDLPPGTALMPGHPVGGDGVRTALQSIAALSSQKTRVASAQVSEDGRLTLSMADGLTVRMGGCADTPQKLNIVAEIYRRRPDVATQLVAVNLTSPDHMACTVRTATHASAATRTVAQQSAGEPEAVQGVSGHPGT